MIAPWTRCACSPGWGPLLRLSSRQVSARDALHLAIMERHRIPRIMSFDPRFAGFPGIERIS